MAGSIEEPGIQKYLLVHEMKNGNVSFYPLYDWNFHDVWKYIYDEKPSIPRYTTICGRKVWGCKRSGYLA